MRPRERILTALDHREGDRVPRDLAGTRYSSIHAEAYQHLRSAMGLPEVDIHVVDISQGLAGIHADLLDSFGADVGLVSSGPPSTYRREMSDDGEYERFTDEWGVVRARPKGGLYFESSTAPLAGDISDAEVEAFPWPDGQDPRRFEGMAEQARRIRNLIPDLIEIGVDILNPVQVSAAGMDTAELKAEFGRDLVFWGGTVDSQKVLARGTAQEVHDEARRRIEELKPGGGFVFASVHNIQAQVPPENILAMWQALEEVGTYG